VTERLLTARELADLLGFAASTIVDWSERGDVPAFKIGGRLRFRESEVLAWLEGQRLRNVTSQVLAPSRRPPEVR
jgi:excisionase family DNA binding protein